MDEHQHLKRLHEEKKRVSEERQKVYSKKTLTSLLNKKFKTTMIGALASFEDSFGHLWGHGKPVDELDDQESLWKDLWDGARTDILNKGNSQMRAALDELNQYEVDRKRYSAELVVKPIRSNDDE